MNGGREPRRPMPALGCSAIDDDDEHGSTNSTIQHVQACTDISPLVNAFAILSGL
jgi:hypothetical protein